MNSEEHMMKLLPENFSITDCRSSQTGSDVSALDLIADIHSECLNLDGTLTLRFHSDHAVINFSVFPSHYYLYGFEVEESCRGKGYGAKFLSTVLAQLLNGNAAAIEHSPLSPETSYHISDVRSAGAAADNTAPRPVLLQVSGGNAPALTLYKKQGSVSPKPCAAISIKLYLIGTAVDFTLPQSPIRSLHRILIELEQIFLTLPVLDLPAERQHL